MTVTLRAAVCALALVPMSSMAQQCAGFSDVPAADPFCPNVEWIRNRGVTLGCTATTYCPGSPVTRLQMAAFMNRLGTALTPTVITMATASGALALDSTPVVCQTPDQDIDDFPRRASIDGSLSGTSPTGVDFGARAVYSANGGASWQPLHAVQPATFVAATRWAQASDVGTLDLAVGATVRFGLQAARVGAGTQNLTDSRCHLRVSIGSRDGIASPF
jgi:hypothetical protein